MVPSHQGGSSEDGEDRVEQSVWRRIKRKEEEEIDGDIQPITLHLKLIDIHSIVLTCLQEEAKNQIQTEPFSQQIFNIAKIMLDIAQNFRKRDCSPFLEYFLIEEKTENRVETLAAMTARVTQWEWFGEWSDMKIVFETLMRRTKSLGDRVSKVLGTSNILDYIDYSLATFVMALYATIVTENTYYFQPSQIERFTKLDDFDIEAIETPDFEKCVQFLVSTYDSGRRKTVEINERVKAAEAVCSVPKMSPDGLSRRDAMHKLVEKIHQRKAKKKEDVVKGSPTPQVIRLRSTIDLEMFKNKRRKEQYRLLNRYMNIKRDDIGPEFFGVVYRHTNIHPVKIEKFFKRLQRARKVSKLQFVEQPMEEYIKLYG